MIICVRCWQVFWLVSEAFGLLMQVGAAQWHVALNVSLVCETHSSGTAQDLHLVPFYSPFTGDQNVLQR